MVRGKGNRFDQVPLPADVGGPLARYLRDARPAGTAHRQVFLALSAPRSAGTTQPPRRASWPRPARCRDQRGKGAAHLLRHTAACGVLAAGGGLAEAGRAPAARRPGGDRRLRQVRYHRAAVDRPAMAGRRPPAMSTDLRAAISSSPGRAPRPRLPARGARSAARSVPGQPGSPRGDSDHGARRGRVRSPG